MWIDACGEIHFEFWQGLKLNGKTYKSLPLYNLCFEYGDSEVLEVCQAQNINPEEYNLSEIHKHLKINTFQYK
jgi:hypothetical protein